MIKLFTVLLFLSLLLPSAVSSADNSSWGEIAQGVRCSISTSSTQWSKKSSAMITIIIENVTSQQKDFTVTTAFNLGLLKYWSPVKLAKESELLPPNTSFDLSIGAGMKLT